MAAEPVLKLGKSLNLPIDVVTQVVAILAKRSAGKSFTAAVMVEEMVAAGAQVVVLDPLGAWWGLRSSASGNKPGLPFVIIGGDHADIALDPGAGKALAELVAAEAVLLVIDMSSFESESDKTRFATDFLDTLYRKNRKPLHVVLEEADEVAPQVPQRGERKMLGAAERLVRRGRQRGIGVTLISQRSAALSKGVLSQADVLIALRTPSPHDQKAISLWIEKQGDPDKQKEVMSSLATLPVGTAWVWVPDQELLIKSAIRRRRTFDSGATPKLGKAQLLKPATFASVNVEALQEAMASAVERHEQSDPDALNRHIARLEQQLAAATAAAPVSLEPVIVEVPVIPAEVTAAFDDTQNLLAQAAVIHSELGQELNNAIEQISSAINNFPVAAPQALASAPQPVVAAAVPAVVALGSDPVSDMQLGKAQRSILSVLAQHQAIGRTKIQTALLAGYKASGGGFRNALGDLRTRELITRSDPMFATAAGLAAIQGSWVALPQGSALLDYWVNKLGKAAGLILRALADKGSAGGSTEDVAAVCGYEPTGGGFRNAVGKLRTLDLITGVRGENLVLCETLRTELSGRGA